MVAGDPVNTIDPNGELALGGALLGGGLDLAIQLARNGGKIRCVSWRSVAGSAALGAIGAVGGGAASGYITGAFKHSISGKSWLKSSQKWKNVSPRVRRAQQTPSGNQLHHWAIERNSFIGKRIPDVIKNHPWNLSSIHRGIHTRIHGRNLRANLPKYNAVQRWKHGTPSWAKTGQIVGGTAGGAIRNSVGGHCGC
jgi:hypothetical protein